MEKDALIGNWRLVSWENISEDGEVTLPFGPKPVGYITYTNQSFMSVSIMRPDRPNFADGDVFGGTVEERAAASLGYLTYCGPYEFDGTTVIHHIEVALFPNWIGGEQIRFAELAGDILTFRTPVMMMRGKEQSARLRWKRV